MSSAERDDIVVSGLWPQPQRHVDRMQLGHAPKIAEVVRPLRNAGELPPNLHARRFQPEDFRFSGASEQ